MADLASSPSGHVVIRADADLAMGGGHAMRCLTLANAMAEADAETTFVAAAMPEQVEQRIAAAGHRLVLIPASPEMQREGAKWEEPPLSAEAQAADAEATRSAIGQADWVVVDHYLLDRRWHSAARSFANHVLVIDDLANRPYDCDILLDQTFGRSPDDYRGLVPSEARILAGATYALLRPDFARERPAALDRRQGGGPVRRTLISLGTADPGGTTARVLEQLLARAPDYAIDVIIGTRAASADRVQELASRHPGVAVHSDSQRMAELMRDADIAIGAAGTTSWERCCLGLPTISLILADNQRLVAENLERAGAVMIASSAEEVPALVDRLTADEPLRLSMVAAAAAIADGEGARRVSKAMAGATPKGAEELTLRLARAADSRSVWLWRNDFITRKFSQTPAPIPWPDHEAWWQRTYDSPDRHLIVAEVEGVPVAALRFDRLDDSFEVSINLAPEARGRGLGRPILGQACQMFLEQHGPVGLFATIHCGNAASRKIFEGLGFVPAGALSNSDFERYALDGGTGE